MPPAHPRLSPRVVVFGRGGCHLCTDAEAIVAAVCDEVGETWAKIAIDEDPALRTAYAELIPVVTVDGVEVARYRIDARVLATALEHPRV